MKKIILERNKCMGCGTCAVVCSSCFEMSEDGRSTLKEGKGGEEEMEKEIENCECAEEAAQSCPVQCIHVEEA